MNYLIPSIIVFIIFIVVFMLLREFFSWYFKINDLLKHQKLQSETLLKIYEQNGGKVDWEKVKKVIHD